MGRNSVVLSRRRESQRVEGSKGPRVKASEVGAGGDKMEAVLSIKSVTEGFLWTKQCGHFGRRINTTALRTTLARCFLYRF